MHTLEYHSAQYSVYMTVHKKFVLEITYLIEYFEFSLMSLSS